MNLELIKQIKTDYIVCIKERKQENNINNSRLPSEFHFYTQAFIKNNINYYIQERVKHLS